MGEKLVIFDLDGVLTDACEWHRIALNEALKRICDFEISMEDHVNTFNGIPTKKKLRILADKGIVKENDFNKIFELKQKITVEIIREQADYRPEKVEMIQRLREKGIHVACYTNSIRETAELMLRKTGVLDLLEEVITNEDVDMCKPNPEGYLILVEKFNVLKENVIIIEDSPKGLEAAYASGCKVIAVPNPDSVSIDLLKDLLSI